MLAYIHLLHVTSRSFERETKMSECLPFDAYRIITAGLAECQS